MKNEIVHVDRHEIYVSSKTIADMLEVPHRNLLRTVEKIVKRQQRTAQDRAFRFPQIFKKTTFTNAQSRTFPMYDLNESAYMKLAMQLSGYEKAEIVQDAIIESFQLMKQALLNHENASWIAARTNGKLVRREETDVIKQFVEYATTQGSKSAEKYYIHITKMTYKALELLTQSKHGEPLRDLASAQELGHIRYLEERAKESLKYGMEQELPYSSPPPKVEFTTKFSTLEMSLSKTTSNSEPALVLTGPSGVLPA
jgi:Rha family phage regulatory protein